MPFGESQNAIKEKLLAEKQDLAFQEHVDKVKKRIPVEIFDTTHVAQNSEPGTTSR